jgi:hypothetical protein
MEKPSQLQPLDVKVVVCMDNVVEHVVLFMQQLQEGLTTAEELDWVTRYAVVPSSQIKPHLGRAPEATPIIPAGTPCGSSMVNTTSDCSRPCRRALRGVCPTAAHSVTSSLRMSCTITSISSPVAGRRYFITAVLSLEVEVEGPLSSGKLRVPRGVVDQLQGQVFVVAQDGIRGLALCASGPASGVEMLSELSAVEHRFRTVAAGVGDDSLERGGTRRSAA